MLTSNVTRGKGLSIYSQMNEPFTLMAASLSLTCERKADSADCCHFHVGEMEAERDGERKQPLWDASLPFVQRLSKVGWASAQHCLTAPTISCPLPQTRPPNSQFVYSCTHLIVNSFACDVATKREMQAIKIMGRFHFKYEMFLIRHHGVRGKNKGNTLFEA